MSRAGFMQRPAFQVVNFPFAVTLMGGAKFSPTLWAGTGWAGHRTLLSLFWNVSRLLGWAELSFALRLDGN